MRHLIALILGLGVGAAFALAFLYFNPFTAPASLSPLSVSSGQQFSLAYSAVAEDAIIYTNDGESRVRPHPTKVLQLWEAPIRQTDAMVTLLRDGRGETVGFGVKFSSRSERTRVLNGEVLVDSVWHVYLPGQGTLLIEQSENYFGFLREIVVPAQWSSSDSWKGNWHGTITDGPGALGTARVHGGSGAFEDLQTEAIESLSAKAYSNESGPVAIDGTILIEVPVSDNEFAAEASAE